MLKAPSHSALSLLCCCSEAARMLALSLYSRSSMSANLAYWWTTSAFSELLQATSSWVIFSEWMQASAQASLACPMKVDSSLQRALSSIRRAWSSIRSSRVFVGDSAPGLSSVSFASRSERRAVTCERSSSRPSWWALATQSATAPSRSSKRPGTWSRYSLSRLSRAWMRSRSLSPSLLSSGPGVPGFSSAGPLAWASATAARRWPSRSMSHRAPFASRARRSVWPSTTLSRAVRSTLSRAISRASSESLMRHSSTLLSDAACRRAGEEGGLLSSASASAAMPRTLSPSLWSSCRRPPVWVATRL
mmetsp:Transcript_65584/g.192333  ORF Transcript_65584/g.192333 Transcript_65584/m.192333 type:complete len:305 (-) Transcript_65584:77-991(-)